MIIIIRGNKLFKLDEEGVEELLESYNTMEILDAVEALDEIRYVIADDYDLKPPEIRYQLLKIHKLAFKQLGEEFTLDDEEVAELVKLINEVDTAVQNMISRLVMIHNVLMPLSEKMFKWEDEKSSSIKKVV